MRAKKLNGKKVFVWAIAGLFFVYFRLFKQTLQFIQQINVKNVFPVYGAGVEPMTCITRFCSHNH